MAIPTIVTGDDTAILATLLVDNAVQAVTGQTIRAAIVSTDYQTVMVGPVTLDEGATGADWANGLVVIEFSSSDTTGLNSYLPTSTGRLSVFVEIEADPGSRKQTWFGVADVVRGNIT